ncbi:MULTISPECIES: DNA cytosine methyltransferase [Prevotella]|uniref:Cytosine-specific methyltransferase n=1 Tax=Prevotella nigrescens TaxID=28133 RepID=A0A9D5WTX6_9BACT|nr:MULTISPECIES: DNA cytosine methyltransferase [Prevotella]MBF1446220.1 DNA cytosine methyltransferase [Prevotella nigrescens]
MTKKEYTVIDLFAGAGGLSLGLYQAGWHSLFAIEKNPFAFETLKYNLIDRKKKFNWPEWLPIINHDINEVLKNYFEQLMDLQGKVDLVAGGPPCQGFSMAGKRVKDDVRNQLVFSYIKFIKLVQPKMVLFENVKGFTYAFNKKKEGVEPYSQIVINALEGLGYAVKPHVIDFSEYGVPQRRKRFILVGVKEGLCSPDKFEQLLKENRDAFLAERGLSTTVTLQEAISDLLRSNGELPTPDRKGFNSGKYGKRKLTAYEKLMRGDYPKTHEVPNSHSFAHHTSDKQSCYKRLLAEYPERGKRIDGKAREEWGIKQRGIIVLDPNTVSPTITGQPDDYLHYVEPRIMTVRECARIQSFPDWYEIQKKYTTGGQMRKIEVPRYSQVGNAIPPLFAEQAGNVLKQMLQYER